MYKTIWMPVVASCLAVAWAREAQQENPSVVKSNVDPVALQELRASSLTLATAVNYRFEVKGSVDPSILPCLAIDKIKPDSVAKTDGDSVGKDAGDERVAKAKDEDASKKRSVSVDIRGQYENGKPLSLNAQDLEAFRGTSLIALKVKESSEWSPMPLEFSKTKSHANPDGADRREIVASMIAIVPPPHELLRDLDIKLSGLRKVDEKAGKPSSGGTVFEGEFKPGTLLTQLKSPPRCSIRVGLNMDGSIDRLELAISAPESSGSQGQLNPKDGEKSIKQMELVYEVKDFNNAPLQVPESARKSLGA